MYSMKKNQIIITALVIMIIIAGYFNYNDKVEETLSDNLGMNNDISEVSGIFNEEFDFDPIFEVPETTVVVDAENKEESETDDEEETKESSKEEADQPGTAVFVDSSAISSSFFSEKKLEREQVRAKAKEDLYTIINSKEATEKAKDEAATRLNDYQQRMVDESQIEALLEAKGFKQVYVCIGEEENIDVVVDKQELSKQDIAKIYDAVRRKTGVGADKIFITPFRANN